MSPGCTVGIDPGDRWVGVARAAHGSSLALPVGTIDRVSDGDLGVARVLRAMLGDEQVSELVIGVPLRQDGREDAQAEAFREFGEALAASLGAVCIAQDERFSSDDASKPVDVPRAGGNKRKSRARGRRSIQRQRRERERSHATAAARILQRWLDARDGQRARELADNGA